MLLSKEFARLVTTSIYLYTATVIMDKYLWLKTSTEEDRRLKIKKQLEYVREQERLDRFLPFWFPLRKKEFKKSRSSSGATEFLYRLSSNGGAAAMEYFVLKHRSATYDTFVQKVIVKHSIDCLLTQNDCSTSYI